MRCEFKTARERPLYPLYHHGPVCLNDSSEIRVNIPAYAERGPAEGIALVGVHATFEHDSNLSDVVQSLRPRLVPVGATSRAAAGVIEEDASF